MTDTADHHDEPPSGSDPFEELASAYLDGEVSDDEAARVDADPALRARVAELRAIAVAVGHPVEPPDADVRDAHIGAALAAADEPAEHRLGAGAAIDLGAERAARDRHRRRLVALSVAAAVLVAVLAVPLLSRLTGDGDGEVATVQDRAESAAEESGAPTTLAESAAGDAGVDSGDLDDTAAAPPAVALGSFADEDELLAAVSRRQGEQSSPEALAETTTPAAPAEPRCPAPLPPDAEIVAVYEADLAGEPVTVYVYRAGTAESVLVLDAGCDPLLDTDL